MSDMKWSIEYPTKIGFYWMRNLITVYDEPGRPSEWPIEIVELLPSNEEPDTLAVFWTADAVPTEQKEVRSAEWYGPLEPPIDPSRCAYEFKEPEPPPISDKPCDLEITCESLRDKNAKLLNQIQHR